MKKTSRQVKAQLDNSGLLVFHLVQGGVPPKTVKRFAYGLRHGIWMRMENVGRHCTILSAESAGIVKEEIARWRMSDRP